MQVQFEGFEGPLDLLLHLINTLEIDIYDIPMTLITEQYMSYIQAMQRLELDVASKYMVMAATLLSIKSKMLLPIEEEKQMDIDYEDPRQSLVDQLLEYQKVKEAAQWFDHEQEAQLNFFVHDILDLSSYTEKNELKEDAHGINELQKLMQNILTKEKELETKSVAREEISIQEEIEHIYQLACQHREVNIQKVMEKQTLAHNVVTFLALLELVKNHKISIQQKELFSPLYICKREGA